MTEHSAPSLFPVSAPQPDTPARRWPALLCAVAAGLCWAGALVLLLWVNLSSYDHPLSPIRLLFYILTIAAGLLTFVPIQRSMQLPGLAFEGVAGSTLLFYTLAVVPPPTDSLLSLPDLVVYVILAASVFWTVSAVVLPLIYAIGQRVFHQRARQYDLRRSRRQAHGVGFLAAICVLLAGLHVLTPLSVVLLVFIMVVLELLFLSLIETKT